MDKFLLWSWIGAALAAVGVGLLVWWRRPATTQEEDKDRLQMEYFRTALHYYVLGRYATTARLSPTPGNLIHHAIEFFLKAALIEKLDEAARRNKFRHNLGKLWRRYKRERNDPALDKFNQTISDINKFERIRYPEEMLRLGMLAEIGPVRNTFTPPPGRRQPKAARYQLALDEVDELVKLILQIENVNPTFYTQSLDEHAKRYLDHQNKSPLS
jgi:HEPN domain-containing protein